jgi:membrane protein DedA with SNARE-associated domain
MATDLSAQASTSLPQGCGQVHNSRFLTFSLVWTFLWTLVWTSTAHSAAHDNNHSPHFHLIADSCGQR